MALPTLPIAVGGNPVSGFVLVDSELRLVGSYDHICCALKAHKFFACHSQACQSTEGRCQGFINGEHVHECDGEPVTITITDLSNSDCDLYCARAN